MKKHKIQLDDAMAKRSVCKRNVIVVFTLALAAFSGHAFAEGGCPAGQYPIGGQGVQGCAPIPGPVGRVASLTPRKAAGSRHGGLYRCPLRAESLAYLSGNSANPRP